VATFKGNKRRKKVLQLDPTKIYLDGVVFETLPAAHFRVRVDRGENVEPLEVECDIKAFFKKKRISIIKGDTVTIELDPSDDLSKGIIVKRH